MSLKVFSNLNDSTFLYSVLLESPSVQQLLMSPLSLPIYQQIYGYTHIFTWPKIRTFSYKDFSWRAVTGKR